jgi:UDP-glucose 4-epimerase
MDSQGSGDNRDATTDRSDHPKVVLVTGACRFLGGYLTARLAQNPAIDHVIAVDAIAPSKDLLRRMGRAEFVRSSPRSSETAMSTPSYMPRRRPMHRGPVAGPLSKSST